MLPGLGCNAHHHGFLTTAACSGLRSAHDLPTPKGPPSSPTQLRAVVWTNCARDTRPRAEAADLVNAPLKQTHKSDSVLYRGCRRRSWSALAELGARRKLHLKGCTFAKR